MTQQMRAGRNGRRRTRLALSGGLALVLLATPHGYADDDPGTDPAPLTSTATPISSPTPGTADEPEPLTGSASPEPIEVVEPTTLVTPSTPVAPVAPATVEPPSTPSTPATVDPPATPTSPSADPPRSETLAATCEISLYSAGTKALGADSYIWGWALGCGTEVTLQRETPDGWKTVAVGGTAADGFFSLLTPDATTPGAQRYRVLAGATTSPVVTLERRVVVTAATAGTKPVGQDSYLWGTVSARPGARVGLQVPAAGGWTEVATTEADQRGYYTLRLDRGRDTVGSHTYRAVHHDPDGGDVASGAVTLTRTAVVLAHTAGEKPLRQETNTWGTVVGHGGGRVFTQVRLPGGWSTSQIRTADANGNFVIPLTYGADTAGTYTFRVVAETPVGPAYSQPFKLRRYAVVFTATITSTTAAEVASTYRAGCPVGPGQLSTIRMTYRDYSGVTRNGEIVVRRDVATAVRDAFGEAYAGGFRIAQMRNPNAWDGNDVAMMAANNTSAFNCRQVTGNPYRVSPHSYGRAVDVNPVENPYYAGGRWYPSSRYATNRPAGVIGMHYRNGQFVTAMQKRGFRWLSGFDWHHFER